MNLSSLFGRLIGLEEAERIERVRVSLAAPWASEGLAWLVFAVVGAALVVVLFYTKAQPGRRLPARLLLAALRSVVILLLVLILAEPVATFHLTSRVRPNLWLLFDGTDSMGIQDVWTQAEWDRLTAALGQPETGTSKESTSAVPPQSAGQAQVAPPRMAWVKAFLTKDQGRLITQLAQRFRLKAFLFDRLEGVRPLELASELSLRGHQTVEPEYLAQQLTTQGQLTAIGAALDDLARRQPGGHLAGIILFSDFNQNAGPSALEAAQRLGTKIHTIGVGPASAVDLAIDLQVPPLLKKAERTNLVATVRQEGLTGKTIPVQFTAQPLGGAGEPKPPLPIGTKQLLLEGPVQLAELPFTPSETGRYLIRASVEIQPGEIVHQNNQAARETNVRDDFLRIFFVEYEPTWEWRFIKEVFHRDRLVGMEGFRTFLRSADPKVRQTNPLFEPTMTLPRTEFFTHDVIILGDMPASALSAGFCQMTKEFVGQFGGGLVVLAGPRFGPGQLAGTPLEELLPVKVNPQARVRQGRPFRLQLTPEAEQYDFMQLGSNATEHRKAWDNLGSLYWYQPVERLQPLATALAVHPTDTCIDGSPQPIIAIGKYQRGEVIYIGFNETWRLRRQYGELYYRQFWGQMIHRLALRHALGQEKRFVVRTDRTQYRPEEQVLVTVEAYDAEFKPLSADKVPGGALEAQCLLPEEPGQTTPRTLPVRIAQLREGIFETRLPVYAPGRYRLRVKDPLTETYAEAVFQVESISVERQQAVRNVALQEALAQATGGQTADLAEAAHLLETLQPDDRRETSVVVVSLWDTWAMFGLVVLLLLGEWLGRKWINLP